MSLWLIITVAAAFLQNTSSLLQKRLTGALSVNGATSIRFIYAMPFAWAYAFWLWDGEPSGFNMAFWAYVLVGGMAQILATAALLASFTSGNFAVGTAFSKTEAAQAAVFGLVVLGDAVSISLVIGILVSLVGVVLLAGQLNFKQLFRFNRTAWLGLAAGAGFALSAVGFRGASLALDGGDYLQRAGLTVMASVTLQTVVMLIYLRLREPGEITRVCGVWRSAVWVGAIGAIASAGWFTAMTLQSAAVVRAVGQIELLFTALTSVFFFRERLQTRDIAGMLLVVLGIWLLLL